ncbi:MAG TPA: hypothetical protein VFM56_05790, partial [Solimonas sp.]|nr:hypothetical protein [Solimonas sp.]
RLVTQVETPSPKVGGGFTAKANAARPAKSRRANLGDGYRDTPVFVGGALRPGDEITGPAIIEESFTTIVVYPRWKARVDDAGDYELTQLRVSH